MNTFADVIADGEGFRVIFTSNIVVHLTQSVSIQTFACVRYTNFGPRCYLTRSSCRTNTCSNNGLCVPTDIRMAESNFTCLCYESFFGERCEHRQTRIWISFEDLVIPTSIRAHFITVQQDADPLRLNDIQQSLFWKMIKSYSTAPNHFMFSSWNLVKATNLSMIHKEYQSSTAFSSEINPSRRCSPIKELLNTTLLMYPTLRKVKYYHGPCKEYRELMCFHDDIFMCLCNTDRHPNCFPFDHNITYDCLGNNYCQNAAECYQDDSLCPTTSICVCRECFYGTHCQFTTEGFGLSLDAILGYHIQPNKSFLRQSIYN